MIKNGSSIYNSVGYKAGSGIEINGDVIEATQPSFIKEYSEDKYYYGGACVRKDEKFYLYNTNKIIHGPFNSNDWLEVDQLDVNKFYSFGNSTANSNLFNFCNFKYNPYLKIFVAHINICFTSQIKSSFNMNTKEITFEKKFRGYASNSGASYDSGGNVKQDTLTRVQVLRDDDELQSGCSFWLDQQPGKSSYGMFTTQMTGYLVTEKG